jgi:hypothetical protein
MNFINTWNQEKKNQKYDLTNSINIPLHRIFAKLIFAWFDCDMNLIAQISSKIKKGVYLNYTS